MADENDKIEELENEEEELEEELDEEGGEPEAEDDEPEADAADAGDEGGEKPEEGDDGRKHKERRDESPEGKRKNRAQERKMRREMRQAAKIRDKLTIQRLRETVSALQDRVEKTIVPRMEAQDINEIDKGLSTVQENIRYAESLAHEAFQKGDSGKNIQAMKILSEANGQMAMLNAAKEEMKRAQANKRPVTPPVNTQAIVKNKASEWMNKTGFSTWTPQEREFAHSVDNGMAREGWNMTDDGYYSELSRRLRDDLPHRFGGAKPVASSRDDAATPKKKVLRRGPTSGGDSDGGSGGDAFEKGIPKDHIDAWKKHGLWNDKDQKKRMRDNYFLTKNSEKRG